MDRESIWSVPSGTQRFYFALFVTQIVVAALLLLREGGALLDAWGKLGPVAIASAATAITATEIGGTIVVLARGLAEHMDRRKRRTEQELRDEIQRLEQAYIFKLMEDHPGITTKELRRLIQEKRGRGAASR